MLKKTPLNEIHRQLNAKMVPFAGWEMPVTYPTGVITEHLAVRKNAGLFDVCHMGQILVEGKDALDYIQRLTTNDASTLVPGQVQYTLVCYPEGGVVDDMTVYKLGAERYLFCVNASRCDDDFTWMRSIAGKYGFSCTVENLSSSYGLLALQGPKAAAILAPLANIPLETIKTFHFAPGKVAGIETLVSRTGYTGEDGFELYVPRGKSVAVWEALMEAGKAHQLLPIGLGARDTLRLEKKYSLYGHELNDTITPLEAGLGWVTKLDKPDFVGKAVLAQMKQEGVPRRSICLKMQESGVPREGYEVFDGDRRVGIVTSGTMSPSLKQGIAIALVESGAAKAGVLSIDIHGRHRAAAVVKPPFV
ncbi:MAG: glycine cleavage system aminomethyltransferase GcvT [Deltaproteobacteria bacterium]|nr:glycine cleavage system aminomethyltransferase GcvT [Deltaproteobacteria bacterium]